MDFLFDYKLLDSVTYFWVALSIFILTLFIAESIKNGFWALASFIILVTCYYYYSNFNLLNYFSWVKLIGYLFIGLIFSIIRCYFYAKKQRAFIDRINNNYRNTEEEKIEELSKGKKQTLADLKGNVFRWWFMWPASLIYWICSDIVSDIFNLIYSKVNKIYENIVERAFK